MMIMIKYSGGDHPVLDPDALFPDKLSGENIEEDTVDDDSIRRNIPQRYFA